MHKDSGIRFIPCFAELSFEDFSVSNVDIMF